jgi:glyoxylase-like metal-dependent hydrolase (beta-lactamase superfamily II)
MFKIGDVDIQLVNESVTLVDAGGPFGLVPRALWSRYMQPDPLHNNLLPMWQNCLLVRVAGKIAVVDTGYGTKHDTLNKRILKLQRPRGTLVEGLARAGVAPEDVDLVIDTHLHGDHCGGNTTFDADGVPRPTFPNAEYVVQRREYFDAARPNERTRATYLPENYEPLFDTKQLTLLDGDTELLPGIHGVVTPGHTPGHMSVVFEGGDDKAIFVCDMASYAVHFERLAWMTAYDVEPLVTLETKRHWQAWALEHDALVISAHDPARYAGRLRKNEKGNPTFAPVAVTFA